MMTVAIRAWQSQADSPCRLVTSWGPAPHPRCRPTLRSGCPRTSRWPLPGHAIVDHGPGAVPVHVSTGVPPTASVGPCTMRQGQAQEPDPPGRQTSDFETRCTRPNDGAVKITPAQRRARRTQPTRPGPTPHQHLDGTPVAVDSELAHRPLTRQRQPQLLHERRHLCRVPRDSASLDTTGVPIAPHLSSPGALQSSRGFHLGAAVPASPPPSRGSHKLGLLGGQEPQNLNASMRPNALRSSAWKH